MNVNTPTGIVTVTHRPNNLPGLKGRGIAIAAVTFSGTAGLPFTFSAVRSYALGDEAAKQQAEGEAVAQLADDVSLLIRHRFAPPIASSPQVPGGTP